MGEDELAGFINKYEQLVDETFDECENEFSKSGDWDFQRVWEIAQRKYGQMFSNNNTFALKMADAAVLKERDEPIDWGEAKQRIVQHGQAHTHDDVRDFLPSHYAMFAGDELINHAVREDVRRKLEQSG